MKKVFKIICIIPFLLFITNLYSYEIIRDPIFEDYFLELNKDFKLKKVDVYLVKNNIANAFVIGENIYFTTGLLMEINDEDTLKAIYLHEYGHVDKNHFQSKKINIQKMSNKSLFYNLFAVGIAALSNNNHLGIGTSISLNSNLVNNISKHSVSFEIEADNFMLNQIKKNQINTAELISFLSKKNNPNNKYFRTHPRNEDRINNLKEYNYKKSENSMMFEWIKSKYSNNSNIISFNIFFKNLEKGIYDEKIKLNYISEQLIQYEAFKKGFFIESWKDEFQNLLNINENSFLRIEYINYYYIYGKYYNKISNEDLSNFFFCQFYKAINSMDKSDFFCKKYDIKAIPNLDKSYALFK